MYEDYYDSDEYGYRPDGFTGPMGGPPFGQQPPMGGPPFGAPPFGGGQGGPPSGPPPAVIPAQPPTAQGFGGAGTFIAPGTIRPCLFRYVYIWLDNGNNFWAWLIFVRGRTVAGWRWTGFRWVYFAVNTNRIDSFVCF